MLIDIKRRHMLLECINCGNGFEGTKRAKYCSDKCKVAFNRNNLKEASSVTPSIVTSDSVTETVTIKLSQTDALFQQDAIARNLGPNWLAFSDVVRTPTCNSCGKTFRTKLSLLRFCSPACRSVELGRPA